MFTQEKIKLAKPTYEAIKKIAKTKGKKWEWRPRVGEWFLFDRRIRLVCNVNVELRLLFYPEYIDTGFIVKSVHQRKVIPFFHWEKLEEIVEGLGYILQGPFANKSCFVARFGVKGWAEGKTRQEVVMRAIIELGEEIVKIDTKEKRGKEKC